MRPIDLHLESLRQLGAVIEEENGGSWKENPNQDQRETQVSAQTGMLTADGTHMHEHISGCVFQVSERRKISFLRL